METRESPVPVGEGVKDEFMEGSYVCDFCKQTVSRVRRVALDRDYDRLGVLHALRYACEPCSARKESERRGAATAG